MVDGIVEVISKPELLEVSHTDFYNHISWINNIASEDKLEILAEFDSSSSTEANFSGIEGSIDEKSGESITADTEKNHIGIEKYDKQSMSSELDEINIEICHRSGCQALQSKKMTEEIKFLR